MSKVSGTKTRMFDKNVYKKGTVEFVVLENKQYSVIGFSKDDTSKYTFVNVSF